MDRSGHVKYDVIVVGAGIEGFAAAYNSIKSGAKTLLLEQFALPHTRGSSHGQSRLIRKAYIQKHYSAVIDECYTGWRQLERESGQTLLQKCPMLSISRTGPSELDDISKTLKSTGADYVCLSTDDLNAQYPQIHWDGHHGVLDRDAGVLLADKCLAAYQRKFQDLGGCILDQTKVIAIEPGTTVGVKTSSATHKCRSVIVTVGPWTKNLLLSTGINLPLQAVRVGVFYWKTTKAGYSLQEGFPSVWAPQLTKNNHNVYCIPSLEYPGLVKTCLSYGHNIEPDKRDIDIIKREMYDIEEISDFVRNYLPSLEDKPSIVESCIYTKTPDEEYILDVHPNCDNIVIGAGFSGHGFKMAPVVGKILSQLALGQPSSYDITPFTIKRFGNDVYSNTKGKL